MFGSPTIRVRILSIVLKMPIIIIYQLLMGVDYFGPFFTLLIIFITIRLSLYGMTMRHLLFGYMVVINETGKPANLITLFIRDIVTNITLVKYSIGYIFKSSLNLSDKTIRNIDDISNVIRKNKIIKKKSHNADVNNEIIKVSDNLHMFHDMVMKTSTNNIESRVDIIKKVFFVK